MTRSRPTPPQLSNAAPAGKPGRRRRGFVAAQVDAIQRAGLYTFTGADLARAAPLSRAALQAALRRLTARGRIVRALPRHDFFIVVPHEFYSMGAPPSTWYLDALMQYLGLPTYYVGLLTAAEWHGATHFAVQETQVIAPRQLRPMTVGRERIRFFTKTSAAGTAVELRRGDTGSVRVSTPEATAVDLVRYLGAVGSLSAVATVLAEMHSRLDPRALARALRRENDVTAGQRLGYLFECVRAPMLADAVAAWLAKHPRRVRPLDPRHPASGAPVHPRWQLSLNTPVEIST